MSAVDVRAAHAEAYALLLGFGEREAAGRINSVNEAVAELIEADREYDAAKEDLATQRRQVGAISSAEHRFKRAHNRRGAALANIGAAP